MIFKPRTTDEPQRTPAQDYAEAREILHRLQRGDRAVFTDMAGNQTPLADMREERKDDE